LIPEPLGGAHRDYTETAENIKKEVISTYKALKKYTMEELKENRYNRFRVLGQFTELS